MANNNQKTEMAKRIAKQTKRSASNYDGGIGEKIFGIIRSFSSVFDKWIYDNKWTKVVSGLLAVILYITVNVSSENSLFDTTLQNSKQIFNVPVTAKYNSDVYEVTGLPEIGNVTILGDGANVTNAANLGGHIVCNLEGLTEGTHEVKLTTDGYSNNVDIKVEPSSVVVTLKKKTTSEFDVSYDFINLDKMDSVYSVGKPEFEYSKVNVRASKDTLESIAFVKALIDVTGVTSDFEQEATLVAYSKKGMPVNVDIVPEKISVKVPVSSPNKTVPIEVQLSGTVPDGMSIDSVDMDQQSVTIYAADSVLSKIDKVVVTLDVSTINKDATIVRPLSLPAGVNSSSVSQLALTVKLGETVTKTIDNVSIYYKNNNSNYRFTPVDGVSTVSVEVTGTQNQVDAIEADDIYVYFDMSNAIPGVQEFTLTVDQASGSLVTYTLSRSSYSVNILGETATDNSDQNDGNVTE